MGPNYVDFTFAFDTTLIQLEMTEIWSEYVAQGFLLRTAPGIGLMLISVIPDVGRPLDSIQESRMSSIFSNRDQRLRCRKWN